MTTTEAIRHLGALSAYANADEVKAVEMAIEALKEYGPTVTLYDHNDPSVPPVAIRNGRQVQVNPGWSPSTEPTASIQVPIPTPPPSFKPRITRNAIECKVCGEVIESKYPYGYVMCKCPGATGCSVEGGLERLVRTGSNYIERSEWA